MGDIGAVGLNQVIIQEGMIINDTRIQYLLVGDKLYQVTHIDFWDLTIEAMESYLEVSDVPEEEVFCLEDFGEFKVTLCNGGGNIVDFEEYVKRRKIPDDLHE